MVRYQYFGEPCCLLQGEGITTLMFGVTTQKTTQQCIFLVLPVEIQHVNIVHFEMEIIFLLTRQCIGLTQKRMHKSL
jgi:hypothetical protein